MLTRLLNWLLSPDDLLRNSRSRALRELLAKDAPVLGAEAIGEV